MREREADRGGFQSHTPTPFVATYENVGKKTYKHGPKRLHNTHKNPTETKINFTFFLLKSMKVKIAVLRMPLCVWHACARRTIYLKHTPCLQTEPL